jgi:hypothetical protein
MARAGLRCSDNSSPALANDYRLSAIVVAAGKSLPLTAGFASPVVQALPLNKSQRQAATTRLRAWCLPGRLLCLRGWTREPELLEGWLSSRLISAPAKFMRNRDIATRRRPSLGQLPSVQDPRTSRGRSGDPWLLDISTYLLSAPDTPGSYERVDAGS